MEALYRVLCLLDETQQYLRRDCLEFTGFPITTDDDPKQLGAVLRSMTVLYCYWPPASRFKEGKKSPHCEISLRRLKGETIQESEIMSGNTTGINC